MTTKALYRMSNAGYCPKRLSAIRNGMDREPAPKWLMTTAEEGNWHEERIKNELRAEGLAVIDEQREITIEQPTYQLVGHIDGIIAGDGDRLLEIKSMSQFQFDKWMRGGFIAFPQYAGQLACYMSATCQHECWYIVKNRSSGYIDRRLVKQSDNGLFNVVLILDKIAEVERLALKGELYPMDFDIESVECKWCEFKYLCLPVAKELNGVDSKVLQSAVDSWRNGDKLQKQGKNLVDSAKAILQSYAEIQPEKKLIFDQLVTSMYSVAEAPVSYIRKTYMACKIKDLRKEDNND